MRIYIKGKDATEEQKKHTRQFSRFFSKKFFGGDISKEIVVKIKYNGYRDSPDYADCVWVDDAEPPREFEVNFYLPEDITLLNYLRCLAHEYTHIKQYALGELKQIKSGEYVKYNGKRFLYEMYYWDRPWEIEAHGREKGLIAEYCELFKLSDLLEDVF